MSDEVQHTGTDTDRKELLAFALAALVLAIGFGAAFVYLNPGVMP